MILTLQLGHLRLMGAVFFSLRSWHLFAIRHPRKATGRGVLCAHVGPIYGELNWGRY